MTLVPGADPQTFSLVCDTCGQAVDGIESSSDHWPVVWALISRQGWGGSPLAIGPHYCPQCFGAEQAAGGRPITYDDQEWAAVLTDNPVACVIRLRGQLDILFAPDLRELLLEAGARHSNLVIDLSEVRLLDSTGLGQLLQARQLTEQRGGRLCLVAPSPFILSVLDTMRLVPVFDIFGDTDQALSWLGSNRASQR